ncbi:hypothetical protein AKJ16_DCAP13217 [Drosera capensis]
MGGIGRRLGFPDSLGAVVVVLPFSEAVMLYIEGYSRNLAPSVLCSCTVHNLISNLRIFLMSFLPLCPLLIEITSRFEQLHNVLKGPFPALCAEWIISAPSTSPCSSIA